MTYIKINDIEYPANVRGYINDGSWDGRSSKVIHIEMDFALAKGLFTDGLSWSIVEKLTRTYSIVNEAGEVETKTEEYENVYDNSEYNVAGDITDHRDGYLSIKMGKQTDLEEAYELLYGGI